MLIIKVGRGDLIGAIVDLGGGGARKFLVMLGGVRAATASNNIQLPNNIQQPNSTQKKPTAPNTIEQHKQHPKGHITSSAHNTPQISFS